MTSGGHLRLVKASSLRYLDLKYCDAGLGIFEEILSSCHLLEKLSMGLAFFGDIHMIFGLPIDH